MSTLRTQMRKITIKKQMFLKMILGDQVVEVENLMKRSQSILVNLKFKIRNLKLRKIWKR